VERRGSDVAEHDADAAKRQRPETRRDGNVWRFLGCGTDSHAEGKTLSANLIRAATCQDHDSSTGNFARAHDVSAGQYLAKRILVSKYHNPQGFRSGGSGGASFISVIVTRRFAASEGSSGNRGWLSALPDTA